MKIRFSIGIILIAIAAFLFAYHGRVSAWMTEQITKQQLPEAQTYVEIEEVEKVVEKVEVEKPEIVNTPVIEVLPEEVEIPDVETPAALPVEFNLAVPFTSQAPFGDWSMPYKEACEETSVMMVDAFYKGEEFTNLSAREAIRKLVEWEMGQFGYFEDTDTEETALILRKYYGYDKVEVVYNPTIEQIKRAVFEGNPVIIPAAGRQLGNRYFQNPGPLYHMLVVRGWTKSGMIITNDPGTKRGEGYLYEPDVLMNAIHDWNKGNIYEGEKVVIVVKK